MITPEILANDSVGVTNQLPRTPETFMPPVSEKQAKPPLPPAFTPAARSQADGRTTPVVSPTGKTLDASEQAALAAAQRIDAQQRAAEQAAAASLANAGSTPQTAPEAAPQTAPATQPLAAAETRSWKQIKEDEKREAEALKKEQKLAEKLAKEQAKRDAEEAKQKAKADKEDAKKREAEEKEQAEEAKRQAALLQERQQEIDAAAERLRASEAAYQAELDKRSSR
jgi:hypothetical protein